MNKKDIILKIIKDTGFVCKCARGRYYIETGDVPYMQVICQIAGQATKRGFLPEIEEIFGSEASFVKNGKTGEKRIYFNLYKHETIVFKAVWQDKEYIVHAENFVEDRSTGLEFGPELLWAELDGKEVELTDWQESYFNDLSVNEYWKLYPDLEVG